MSVRRVILEPYSTTISHPDVRVDIPTSLEGQAGATQYRQYHRQVHFAVEAGVAPEVSFELTGPNTFAGYNNVALAGYYINLPWPCQVHPEFDCNSCMPLHGPPELIPEALCDLN